MSAFLNSVLAIVAFLLMGLLAAFFIALNIIKDTIEKMVAEDE